MGMPRQDIGDTENQQRMQYETSTSALLSQLTLHHDYSVKVPDHKIQLIWIEEETPAEMPVDICILPIRDAIPTVDGIKRVVCRYYGLSHTEMISDRRVHRVVRPRQIAMYLCKELTKISFVQIGARFGDKDHSTVVNACMRIERLAANDAKLSADIQSLRSQLVS
jgi:chromosomal replication initiation ATPase DnaA